MPVQFLDTRISTGTLPETGEGAILPREPFLLGDIGLQTFAVVGTPNQSLIRVSLSGTIAVRVRSDSAVNIYVQRGGTEVLGSGVIIYSAQIDLSDRSGHQLLNFTAVDFPSAADAAGGQIRYTMFAARSGKSKVRVISPVTFAGTAAAGEE